MERDSSNICPYSEQALQREKEVLKPAFTAPFEHIALAFSGGGFRAAAYSLGVLSYLNTVTFNEDTKQKKLLDKVTYLSSASGGSVATSLFTLYSTQGKSFDEFYKKMFVQLSDDVLLKNALTILQNENEWKERPEKSRNLINAFALAYDRYLFDQAALESVLPGNNNEANTQIEEVCFNATEFVYGLLFHQQTTLKKDGYNDPYFFYGNYLTHLEREISYKIRLSDIVAASSCFPAAFEPMIFPNDFVNPHLTASELREGLYVQPQRDDLREREFIKEKTFGLMDGGITDNQGLESMMQADRRRQKKETNFLPFDLMLVNDVATHFMNPYVVPSVRPKSLIGIFTFNSFSILLFLVFLLSTVASVFCYLHQRAGLLIAGIFVTTISLYSFVLLTFIISSLEGTTQSSFGFNLHKIFGKKVVATLLSFFKNTPFRFLFQMIIARGNSMLTLNNDVFMKRIRQLLYNSFYGSPQWQNRGKGNHIYDLSFSNDINRKKDDELYPDIKPGRNLQIAAEVAFEIGVTLWFDEKDDEHLHKEACLISCGQFTTCYNLLLYILRLEKKTAIITSLTPQYKQRLEELKTTMFQDYNKFKVDPFFLYNRYGAQTGIEDFKPLSINEIKFPLNLSGLK